MGLVYPVPGGDETVAPHGRGVIPRIRRGRGARNPVSRPSDTGGVRRHGAGMSLPHPSSLPPGASTGALSRGVRRAAGLAARRPKTIIVLWLPLVVACVAAGGAAGTKTLTDADAGAGRRGPPTSGSRPPASRPRRRERPDPLGGRADERQGGRRPRAPPEGGRRRQLRPGPGRRAELSTNGGRIVLVQARLRGDPDDAGDVAKGVAATVRATSAKHAAADFQQAGDGPFDSTIDDVVSDDLQRAEMISLPITLLVLRDRVRRARRRVRAAAARDHRRRRRHGRARRRLPGRPERRHHRPLVVLIGLAVGVDYSLFYIRREREERRDGRAGRRARRRRGLRRPRDPHLRAHRHGRAGRAAALRHGVFISMAWPRCSSWRSRCSAR